MTTSYRGPKVEYGCSMIADKDHRCVFDCNKATKVIKIQRTKVIDVGSIPYKLIDISIPSLSLKELIEFNHFISKHVELMDMQTMRPEYIKIHTNAIALFSAEIEQRKRDVEKSEVEILKGLIATKERELEVLKHVLTQFEKIN